MSCRNHLAVVPLLSLSLLVVAGCATPGIPDDALRLPESSLEIRAIQTRKFAVVSHNDILAATLATLQDMEYNIDELNKPLGVITASKISDADSTAEKTGLMLLDVLCILGGQSSCGAYSTAKDKFSISMTMVVLPSLGSQHEYVTRITLQRALLNKLGQIRNLERIDDPLIYEQIFAKLSKALFLKENLE